MLELGKLGAFELLPGRKFELARIHLGAVAQNFVMQMRTCRAAGGADIADGLALAHALAGPHTAREALHVGIDGLVGPVVADTDVVAVSAVSASSLDDAIAGRDDGRAARRGEIQPAMHLVVAEHRMPPHAVPRRQAGAVDRCSHERLARALSFDVEVIDRAICGFVTVKA